MQSQTTSPAENAVSMCLWLLSSCLHLHRFLSADTRTFDALCFSFKAFKQNERTEGKWWKRKAMEIRRTGKPGKLKWHQRWTPSKMQIFTFKAWGGRPVTSLGHRAGRRVFWEGPKFFKLCPIVLNYVQHIFQKSPPGYGPVRRQVASGEGSIWKKN